MIAKGFPLLLAVGIVAAAAAYAGGRPVDEGVTAEAVLSKPDRE